MNACMKTDLLSFQRNYILKHIIHPRWLVVGAVVLSWTVFTFELGAQKPEPQPSATLSAETAPVKTYTYKTLPDGQELKADVFGVSEKQIRPVILNIHGGALMMGDRKLSTKPDSLLDKLLKAGYVVVSIDYRLAPHVKLPAIIEDVQDSYRWVHDQGPKLFHIDPKRIGVMGGSAGGYLTLMTGFCVKPRPNVLVSLWGYGDIAGAWYSRPDPFYNQQPAVTKEEAEKAGGSRLYLYARQQGLWPKIVSGHDPDTELKWFNSFCPVRNVTKKYPPTFLVHGDKDTDVPYAQSVMMEKELASKGVLHEFITIPNGGHGFNRAQAEIASKTYDQVVAFVNAHLK